MALSKLIVYQLALQHLGDHRLALITDDVEARYALDQAWDRAVAFVFQAAYWRFALKTAILTHNGALTPTLPGFSSTFAQPAGYYRPHALFVLSGARECPVDARQVGILFHANVTPIYLRYVDSTLIATPESWPETVGQAVGAYLAFLVASRLSQDPQAPGAMKEVWSNYFATAQAIEAVDPDPWLRHQLSGRLLSVVSSMLEDGSWRFAIKTVELADNVATPSSGYAYAFDKPADWIKTFDVYQTGDATQTGIDFREEAGDFHASFTPITVRYSSTTLGIDASNWSAAFESAVLAELAVREALETPGTSGAALQALATVAKERKHDASGGDDQRERPLVNQPSRFVSGRYGAGWGRSFREQG
jgi:hypothetical protein